MVKKILVADDDLAVRSLIRRALRSSGKYEIHISTTVTDTRDACESFRPDLLIIDDLHGGGVAFGNEQHRQGKMVIITSVITQSHRGAPEITKGSEKFSDRLVTKAKELLGE